MNEIGTPLAYFTVGIKIPASVYSMTNLVRALLNTKFQPFDIRMLVLEINLRSFLFNKMHFRGHLAGSFGRAYGS